MSHETKKMILNVHFSEDARANSCVPVPSVLMFVKHVTVDGQKGYTPTPTPPKSAPVKPATAQPSAPTPTAPKK